MTLNADHLLLQALQEDITSEDVSTNSVMPQPKTGEVDLICKAAQISRTDGGTPSPISLVM